MAWVAVATAGRKPNETEWKAGAGGKSRAVRANGDKQLDGKQARGDTKGHHTSIRCKFVQPLFSLEAVSNFAISYL